MGIESCKCCLKVVCCPDNVTPAELFLSHGTFTPATSAGFPYTFDSPGLPASIPLTYNGADCTIDTCSCCPTGDEGAPVFVRGVWKSPCYTGHMDDPDTAVYFSIQWLLICCTDTFGGETINQWRLKTTASTGSDSVEIGFICNPTKLTFASLAAAAYARVQSSGRFGCPFPSFTGLCGNDIGTFTGDAVVTA